MDACDLTCLNPLELKNKRLKQILPERDLDIEILKKIKPKNGALGGKARATGRHADTWLESALACRLIRLSRATAIQCVCQQERWTHIWQRCVIFPRYPRNGYGRNRIFLLRLVFSCVGHARSVDGVRQGFTSPRDVHVSASGSSRWASMRRSKTTVSGPMILSSTRRQTTSKSQALQAPKGYPRVSSNCWRWGPFA